MNSLAKVCLACTLLVVARVAVAQTATADGRTLHERTVKRTAITSALTARARRNTDQTPATMCSAIDAIGFARETLGDSPLLLRRLTDDASLLRCAVKDLGAPVRAWRAFIEVEDAFVRSETGQPARATVTLRAWQTPQQFAREVYEFVVTMDSLWSPLRVEERCCTNLDRLAPTQREPLIVLNGRVLPREVNVENALTSVRGHLIDSIRVYPAGDSATMAKFGSALTSHGVVVIGTHPPVRRPD